MEPDSRKAFPNRKPSSQIIPAQPSDGSPSKCLEQGYGKPLKPARRSFLNFCKQMVRIKELPSNCPPCPTPEPEQSFWDYLFKFDEKNTPEVSTCRVSHRHEEVCETKLDPELCDPLLFRRSSRSSCRASTEPQPKPPPLYPPPKAVVCRRLAERGSLRNGGCDKVDPRCSGPRPFRIPFEECRPQRRTRKPFSSSHGVSAVDVAPPVSVGRDTCGGRSFGEFLAEATIARSGPSSTSRLTLDASSAMSGTGMKISSNVERLRQLTKAAGCGGNSSGTMVHPSSLRDKNTRKMSTEAKFSSEETDSVT